VTKGLLDLRGSETASDAPVATRVLVVDDEPEVRRAIARMLGARGFEVLMASDGRVAIGLLATEPIDVVLVDLMMPNVDGMQLLDHVRRSETGIEVVMMTAFGDVDTAVKAVRAGAYHFLTKPLRSDDEVVLTVAKAAERRQLVGRAAMLEQALKERRKFGELIGTSQKMREVYRLAMGVATTTSTVLILGESGTGKELTARAIHDHSPRANRPFIAVNCSAIPVELVESELFGHVRGAFTGATATREGLFEAAVGGTIFLDEVGDLPAIAQVKLLRTLQSGEVKRVGSNETRHVDVRVVAATNVDLRRLIAEGRFREDLYYRLHVVAIELPALRERADDIPILAHHFLRKHSARMGRKISDISAAAVKALMARTWQGNVRELENAIEHAIVFCTRSTLDVTDLPFGRHAEGNGAAGGTASDGGFGVPGAVLELPYREAKQQAVAAFDAIYFSGLLERTGGNVSEAARRAALDRSNFRRAARKVGAVSPRR
jgi:DNA-binding NtrC family response regulator